MGNKKAINFLRKPAAAYQLLSCFQHDHLTRIFHTDRDEETAKADGVRQTNILTPGCMCTYSPSHNVSLTQDPSAFPVSAGDRCEISGLTRIFHTDRHEEDAKADGARRAMKSDAGLYVYILSKSQCESNAGSICLPGLRR